MIFRIKNIVVLIATVFLGWLGWSAYNYFFDASVPELYVVGVDDNGHYAGDVHCAIKSDKAGELSIALDGKPLTKKQVLRSKNQEQSFTIPTKTISNGTHMLDVQCIDTTYHKNRAAVRRAFVVDNVPLQAALVKPNSDYKVFQGRTLHLQFQVNKELEKATVSALSQTYPCFPESKKSLIYEAFIPITCEEQPNEYLFSIELLDKVGNTMRLDNKFQVVMYPFKKQVLHISKDKIQQEREKAAAYDLEVALEDAAKRSPQEKLWRGSFCTPIDIQRITCDFGTIRTTQHKGRYAHKALDVINLPKSVVWAPQAGVVSVKERYESSGNTVVLDHGWGILSLFFHLDDFADIAVGQKLAKGNPVGTIGKTGYATGYHLHWEMRINNVAVDPLQWTKVTF